MEVFNAQSRKSKENSSTQRQSDQVKKSYQTCGIEDTLRCQDQIRNKVQALYQRRQKVLFGPFLTAQVSCMKKAARNAAAFLLKDFPC